jgi:uncharacterized protein YcbK (DUF882 family)
VTDWTLVKHFKRAEWVKNPDAVVPELVYLVDGLRDYVGRPVVIHVAFDDAGHVEDSAHYMGAAVDLHVQGLSLMDQWLAAERFPFLGVGLYPFWEHPGLHLDVRRVGAEHGPGRRWWRDKQGQYQPFTADFIRSL